MPVDPQVIRLIAESEALGVRPYEELTPAEAREVFVAVVELRRGPAYVQQPVGGVEDRVVDGVGVRIYRPESTAAAPLVVYFHGGGWVVGSTETHDNQARAWCAGTGAVVVSVDYRLAPEHPYPAALQDCYAATRWAFAAAEQLGADPDRIAVAGDSAGGNLAAAVCLLARDRGDLAIAAQALVYPAVDATMSLASIRELASGFLLTASTMRWYTHHYLPDPVQRREPLASPLHAPDLDGLPRAIIATAEYDPLRDEGETYAERLGAAGVPVTLRRYDGLVHGFFGMGPQVDAAQRAIDELCADLRRLLVISDAPAFD